MTESSVSVANLETSHQEIPLSANSGVLSVGRPGFKYEPLQPGQFRLAFLSRGSNGVSIKVRLEVHDFLAPPRYQALSYVWGPKKADDYESIMCHANGGLVGDLLISPNLSSALKNLCIQETGPLWIDAICINQRTDPNEKSAQVNLMHKIFGGATSVIVWLGNSSKSVEHALSLCASLSPYFDERSFSEARDQPIPSRYDGQTDPRLTSEFETLARLLGHNRAVTITAENYATIGLPDFDDSIWHDFSKLYHNSWLQRVWTFEEAKLAKTCFVHYGQSRVSWYSFYETGMRLAHTQLLFHPSNLQRGQASYTMLRSFMYASDTTGHYFWLHVDEARRKQATKEVDHIYGLLALASPEVRDAIPVDYALFSENYRDLYKIAARVIMRNWNVHTVLASIDVQQRDTRLPSWCPDYNTIPSTLTASISPFGAAGSSSRHPTRCFSYGPTIDTIDIGGVLFDEVASVLDMQWQWDQSDPTKNTGPDGYAANNASLFDQIERMITVTRVTHGRPAVPSWTVIAHYIPPDADGRVSTPHNFPPHAETAVHALHGRFRELADNTARSLTLAEHELLGPTMTFLGQMWRDKVFFTTRNGHFGTAVKAIKIGDSVCAFIQESHFYVLRPTTATAMHEFVSVAYIHGMMQGEVFKQRECVGHTTFRIC